MMSQSEQESVFDIHDFSTASDFEKLIDNLEQIIQEWTKEFFQWKKNSKQGHAFIKQESIKYCGSKYEVVYCNWNGNNTENFEEDAQDDSFGAIERTLLDDSGDFSSFCHQFTRWYGIDEFMLLSCTDASKNIRQVFPIHEPLVLKNAPKVSLSETKMLQSAMSVALDNTPLRMNKQDSNWSVPVFVTVNKPQDDEHFGKWRSGQTIVRLRSEVVRTSVPPLYTKVSGLMDLFCLSMGRHLTLRDLLGRVTLSAQYTYIINGSTWNDSFEEVDLCVSKYYISTTFHTDMQTIESSHTELLDVNKSEEFKIRAALNNKFSAIRSEQLEHLINDIYVDAMKDVSKMEPDTCSPSSDGSLLGKLAIAPNTAQIKEQSIEEDFKSEEIYNMIHDMFDLEKLNTFDQHSKPLGKSCQRGSLISRFCHYAIRLEQWDEVRQLWKIFVKVLNEFWEEACSESLETSTPRTNDFQYIPYTKNEIDWASCLLEQKVNMLNICCSAQASKSNQNVKQVENVIRLNNGKKIKIPTTQKAPSKTEDMIMEEQMALSKLDADTRTLVQSASLKSDMQAFKSVNDEHVTFEDFLSWYSPRDVLEDGSLSLRMQQEGNVWHKTWEQSLPVGVQYQKSLFEHEKQAEIVVHELETLDIANYIIQIMYCSFATLYYDLEAYWNEFIQGINVTIPSVTSALKDLHKDLENVLSSQSMTSSHPFADLCSKFSKVESLISQAVSHVKIFGGLPSCDLLIRNLLQNPSREFILKGDQDRDHILAIIRPTPDAREYKFRCMAPRPYLSSKHSAQSMYVMYSNEEFRICTALSEQIPI
ncbi:RabGAP [Acrasis kona]|uniref:Rab3 GTPase-activating protein catalytic subunit n=1 Tax=Acrasis kona TaxID=1008807 RepID=A0AAW2YL81_9EUKA